MARAPRDAADRAAFVRDIVSDPKAVPDVMLLYGYLGASSEEDHERLYLSPDLTNYVEVPASAILHQMLAPKEQDPHGGVTLWVKKDAALVYRMAPAAEAVAHYFAGAIQAGAQAAAAPIPTPPITIGGACTIQQALCPPTPACSLAVTCGPCTHITPCLHTQPGQATCAAQCTLITPCLHTQPGQATCAVQCTHITPCLQTQPGQATCAVQCTLITPCLQTQPGQATCAVQCTHITPCLQTQVGHATCAAQCTHITPCLTHGVACSNAPACFPTEVTPCVPTHLCTAAACAAVGPPQQAPMALQCVGGTAAPAPSPVACSLFQCPTRVFIQCGPHHTPLCPIPTAFGVTCNIICLSHASPCCPVSGGAFCAASLDACGLGQQGPGGAQALAMASFPCGSPVWCTGNMCNTPAHPCTPHCPM